MPLVKKNGFTTPSLIIIVAFGFVLIAATSIAIYFYHQYQQSQSLLLKSKKMDSQQALLQSVGKLIVLPKNEQPSIATVSDVERLKGQSFFANAKNGDKVLIYAKAKEAILYDPVANKIVSVGPIEVTQVTPTAMPLPTVGPLDVAIYNGTATIGLATTVTQQLKTKMPNVTVVEKADAQDTYQMTLVVDLTGKNATQSAALAIALNGRVSTFPRTETKPKNATILIILGK